jgi:hypothetical protein
MPSSTEEQTNLLLSSYQHGTPVVQNLDDASLPHRYYGDATLEPNIGRTNSYDYALFGLALHELLDRLRMSILFTTTLTLFILCFSIWFRIFQPVRLALSLVLAGMILILWIVEIMSIWKGNSNIGTDVTTSSSASISQTKLKTFLAFTEQVGLVILYHPIGKTIYMSICACLCWIVGGLWNWLLGLLHFCNAALLLYCWATYPEFRAVFEQNVENTSDNDDNDPRQQTASWSVYSSTKNSLSSFYKGSSEKASLLKNQFKQQNVTV